MYIDCHVHLRDFNEKYKETVKHGLEVALDSGVDAVFDMPNTNPPLLDEEMVKGRISLAKDARIKGVFYGMYIGVTTDREQVKNAVELFRKYKQIIGIKMYAGHSTNNLGVISIEDQHMVYETLAEEGYNGVLAVHCEKEDEMNAALWKPSQPFTHCLARSKKAEIESIQDQIRFAHQYHFRGTLHIVHVSVPESIALIDNARKILSITCGICPHHFIYNWGKMFGKQGIMYKVNPPLRAESSREQLLNFLRNGMIDWIETDHAPHSLEDKTKSFMSGITGLPWWPLFHEYLRINNFSEDLIEKLTFTNVRDRFELDIEKSQRKIKDRTRDYPFNYYEGLEIELNK